MSKTTILDPQQILRVVDNETLKTLGTRGAENFDKSDYLEIKGNAAPISGTIAGSDAQQQITLSPKNDYSGAVVDGVSLRVAPQGLGVFFPPSGAAPPTWASWMEGAIFFNTTDHKLYVATNAAWVVAGTQS